MGLNNLSSFNYSASDRMLGTILFLYYLLFINTFYLRRVSPLYEVRGGLAVKLDVSRYIILLNSENNNTKYNSNKELSDMQSAENRKGFSETVRQSPGEEDPKF